MNGIKLSIITVNYNNRDGLQKTIDSVLSQIWREFEWIVIDGGSNDGSRELLEKYQKYFAYWCSEPDTGIYNAMNKGIAHAKGQYLNFMNSGDCFNNEKSLFYFGEYFDSTVDVFYGDADFFNYDGKLFFSMILPDNIDSSFYLLGKNISHQSSFIKAMLFKSHPYDESYKLAADGDMFFWLLINGYRFKHIAKVLVRSDIPGLSSDINLANDEVARFLKENIQKLPFKKKLLYKLLLYRVKLYFFFCKGVGKLAYRFCASVL